MTRTDHLSTRHATDPLAPVFLWRLPESYRISLTHRLAGEATIHAVQSDTALIALSRRFSRAITIFGLPSNGDLVGLNAILRVLEHLKQCNARSIYAVQLDARPLSAPTIVELVRAGLSEIVELRDESSLSMLVAWVRCHQPLAVSEAVWDTIGPLLAPAARPLVRAALFMAHQPASVGDLALKLGCSERTLRRWCQQAGICGPLRLLRMMRVMLAGHWLACQPAHVDLVAGMLGFDSAEALNLNVRHLTGMNLTVLRLNGWGGALQGFLMSSNPR
jgi:AraC-like DNA-binding protein